MMTSTTDQQSLQDEIADLERRLQDARSRLDPSNAVYTASVPAGNEANNALHALLLLSDSALPLGSFAFSSGLESYLAHHKQTPSSQAQLSSFHTFLCLSLATLASSALPYVLAGYRRPQDIETLDNDFDASTPCTVARRASIAQGRALLTVWERGFKSVYTASSFAGTQSTHKGDLDENVPKTQQTPGQDTERDDAIAALKAFNLALRTTDYLSGHLPPLWGLVTRILNIPLREAAYLFLFSHARTILSAAVRASVMGPYQAQAVLASLDTQERIRGLVEEGWDRETEDAGQCVPVMDIWVGRHERLYSRIFNS